MSITKRFARGIVAATVVTGLTATGVLLSASAASAKSRDQITDVTKHTASNVRMLSGKYHLLIDRTVNFANENDPVYKYTVDVTGPQSMGTQNCQIKHGNPNGYVLASGKCEVILGVTGPDLHSDGPYVVTIDNNILATFDFTRPTKTPPPLKPAKCKITKVKVLEKTSTGTLLNVANNGLCGPLDGYWSYTYRNNDGTKGGSSLDFTYTKTVLPGVTKKNQNSKVTLTFTPYNYRYSTVDKLTIK